MIVSLAEALARLARGELVAYPTETVYGLGADPFQPAALERLLAAKGRGAERGLSLLVADAGALARWAPGLPAAARRLAARFWPGPLTLLVAAPRGLAAEVSGGTGKVGVRVPAWGVTRAICAAVGRPITATSANVSGTPATADPGEVERAIGDRLDLIIDTGKTPGGAPSTIVDATGAHPVLVREGAIAWSEIHAWLHSAQDADR